MKMSEDTATQPTLLSEKNEASAVTQAEGQPQQELPKEKADAGAAQTAVKAELPQEETQAAKAETMQQPLAAAPKKRGRPRKNAAAAAPALEAPPKISIAAQAAIVQQNAEVNTLEKITLVQVPPKPVMQAIKKVKRTSRVKLSRFDKDAVKLIQEGTQSVMRISAVLGVDGGEARKRFVELEKRGFLSFDASSPDRVCLTIKGYNELRLSPRKEKPAESIEKAAETIPQPQLQPQLQRSDIEVFEEKPTAQQQLEQRIDLAEMLKRGAPREASVFVRRQEKRKGAEEKVVIEEKKLDAQTTELLKKTMREYEGEKCELCRGDFKLALQDGHPKYGHCFCGSAFHRDCYESLLDGTRSCPRCGRALEIILDRQSQEAVNAIRKLFE